MNIMQQSVELLSITPDAERLIERAGRTCYKSEDKITEDSSARFIKMIIKRGHLSVIEHASATFRIITDRGISHELVRHRLAAYSQESTRYVRYGDIDVIEPPGLSTIEFNAWLSHMKHCERAYLTLGQEQKAQIARSVLPTCLKTELVMTANFREWLHVFKMRCDKTAHPQIQEIAKEMQSILRIHAPNVFA